GLEKDSVGYGHLADIVKKSGTSQDCQLRFRHLHGLGNLNAKRRDPLAMSFCFRILQIQCASQGLERFVVGALEFNVLCGELRSAFLDELLEVALIIAI